MPKVGWLEGHRRRFMGTCSSQPAGTALRTANGESKGDQTASWRR